MKRLVTLSFTLAISLQASLVLGQLGRLDESFGTEGLVSTSITVNGLPQATKAEASVVQADGRILVTGSYDLIDADQSPQKFLLRLLSNGDVDSSFGINGVALADLSLFWYELLPPYLQADGSIYLAGYGPSPINPTQTNAILCHYLPNGELDTAFGQQGVLSLPMGAQLARVHALMTTATGRLIVAGVDQQNGLLMLNVSHHGSSRGAYSIEANVIPALQNLTVTDMIPSPQGGFVIVGETPVSSITPNGNIVLVRLQANLQVDSTFGQQGAQVIDLTASPNSQTVINEKIGQVQVQPNGSILITGRYAAYRNQQQQGPTQMLLMRLQPNGQPDPAFGQNGLANVSFNQPMLPMNYAEASGEQVVVQADGHILVTGRWGPFQGSWAVMLLRFTPDGILDTDFGHLGAVLGDVDTLPIQGVRLSLQPNGHAILAGMVDAVDGERMQLQVARILASEPQTTHLRRVQPAVSGVQVFPNPINHGPFQVRYDLPSAQNVAIHLVNLQGQRVATMQESTQNPAGTQQTQLQLTQNLPAGTYFLQIVTGSGSQSTKVIVR